MRSLPLLLLLLAGLLAGARPAAAQEGESVRETRIREILVSLERASPDRIWSGSEEFVKMGAPARRILQKNLKDAPIEGKLAALKALIELDSTAFAAEELGRIAADESAAEEHRVLAVELIGATEERDAAESLSALLLSLNPRIRVAAARSLWRVGDTASKQNAKEALREMLRASDAGLRASGATALAELGDIDSPGVQAELRSLSREPTTRGRLAATLLENARLRSTVIALEARGEAAAGSPLWGHLEEIRQRMKAMYDDGGEIDDAAMRSRAAHGLLTLPNDPHSAFMDPEEHAEWNSELDPSYGGIGALIDTNAKDFRIARPFFGGPAWKADIRTGDAIVAVNGKPTEGREQTEIIKEVKGPPGTSVVLTIYREGWTETKEIPVVRAKIVLPSVFGRMLPGDVGYIEISNFGEDTGSQFVKLLRELEAKGLKGLVIDLRWNPGGSLVTVKECISPFLREGDLICTIKGRAFPKAERHVATKPDRERLYPVSVLINGRSASGAELMSGVLQHYSKRSDLAGAEDPSLDVLVLGEPSFGKGTVQFKMSLDSWPGEKFEDREPKDEHWDDAEKFEDGNGNGRYDRGEPFSDTNGNGVWDDAEPFADANGNGRYDWGAALRMTVARYYLPSGRNFTRQRVFRDGRYLYEGGVVPDFEVQQPPMKGSHIAEFQEIQAEGALRDYVQSRWETHKETFRALAYEDGRDPSRYPDFDAIYKAVARCLTPQEFRRALRIETRRQVANDAGVEIVADLSDDVVLRRGAVEVLRRLGVDPATVAEYRSIADHEKE